MRTVLALLLTEAVGAGAPGLAAQTAADRLRTPPAADLRRPLSIPPEPSDPDLAHTGAPTADPPPGAARVAFYSLVLPGAGQFVRSQRRWLVYAAVEGVGWYLHLDRRSAGRDLRTAYRDLAWDVARTRTGPRVVDDFEYYERMGAWTSSGAWDADATTAGIQPETDAATYNGAIWVRATEIFFGSDPDVGPGDPAWEAALTYYAERAYPPELLWDWSGTGDAAGRFRSLVRESDDQLREATVILGVIVANHVLSAADAFVSARLEERTAGRIGGGVALMPGLAPDGRPAGRLLVRLEVRP